MVRTTLSAALILLSLPAQAETPTEWIELGARVHGAFGAFIPIGIRIGLDAKERIKAEPRGLAVTYYIGQKAPCPCIADGVMLATNAPKGATFLIVPVPATHVMSVVVVASMNLDRLRQVRQGSHWHGQGGRNQSKDNSRRQNCSAHGNLRFSRSGHYSEARPNTI